MEEKNNKETPNKAKVFHRIWDDIMFYVDSFPVAMSIDKFCSTDKIVFKPLMEVDTKYHYFSMAMGKLFCYLRLNDRASRSIYGDHFGEAVFSTSKKEASIIFTGQSEIIKGVLRMSHKPLKYANNFKNLDQEDKMWAHKMAKLLKWIAECNHNETNYGMYLKINGFYRTHHFDPEKKVKKGMFAINYQKHIKEPFS